MRYLDVTVTQDDIDHGRRHDCARCPIARAARRLGYRRAMVDEATLDVSTVLRPKGYREWEYWRVPSRAGAWIQRFDNGLTVKPATFRFYQRGTK